MSDKPTRKRLSAAAKQLLDVQEGDFVLLRSHKGVGVVHEVANAWARVTWFSGTRSGTESDHPLASLRKVRNHSHNLDGRGER